MKRPRAAGLVTALAAVLALPPLAHGATGAEVAALLSTQREANGIPGGITENRDWSARCEKHVRWMELNHRVEHGETPGTPGYSEDGDWAGKHSVLTRGAVIDFNRGNPYITAPYHLLQLLNPALAEMGAFENGTLGCHTTFPGYTRPAPAADTFNTYPGDGATIPWFEEAHESPSVPGDEVGLPQGTITGPNMEVFWRGPDDVVPMRNLVSAMVTDAGGGTIDARSVGNQQNELVYLGAGFVIPAKPLRPDSTYSASATFSSADPDNPRELTHTWSFRTTSLPRPKQAVRVKLKNTARHGLLITLIGKDIYHFRPANLTIDYGRGRPKLRTKAPLGVVVQATPVPKGRRVKVTASVKAFSVGGVAIPGVKVVKRLRAR